MVHGSRFWAVNLFNVGTMIKNGLIIDGEVYDVYFVAGYPCSKCDLFDRCKENMDRECPGQILGEREFMSCCFKKRTMDAKLKRVRFRKDGKLDVEYEDEDGMIKVAEGCTLQIDTGNSAADFPVSFTVHKDEQYLIKDIP